MEGALPHDRLHAHPHTRTCPLQMMAVVTAPLAGLLQASLRQVGAALVVLVAGILSVYVR